MHKFPACTPEELIEDSHSSSSSFQAQLSALLSALIKSSDLENILSLHPKEIKGEALWCAVKALVRRALKLASSLSLLLNV